MSTGQIIRQEREVDSWGNFVKQRPKRTRTRSATLTSAFDDEKEYVLTELGKQFVHYTMNEIVPRIAAAPDQATSPPGTEPTSRDDYADIRASVI